LNTAANYGGFILHGTITTTVTITTVVMMPAEPKTYKRKSTQFKPLTAMQEAYCQSYIKTPENQTQAAINAGFSPNTAAVKASVMMRDERIQKRIAELMEERNKRMRVSADYVLMRLVEIDQMDVIDILNDDGSLKPIREWPKIWRTTLSGFDLSSTIGDKSIYLYDLRRMDEIMEALDNRSSMDWCVAVHDMNAGFDEKILFPSSVESTAG
jgi:phage terminase small subunit